MRQRDFERSIGDKMMPHMEQGASCPSVMGWPEDNVSKWVASHRDETKNIICRSSEGRNVGFCGTTRSRTRTKPIEIKGRGDESRRRPQNQSWSESDHSGKACSQVSVT